MQATANEIFRKLLKQEKKLQKLFLLSVWFTHTTTENYVTEKCPLQTPWARPNNDFINRLNNITFTLTCNCFSSVFYKKL